MVTNYGSTNDLQQYRIKTYNLPQKMIILSSYPLILKRDNWSYLKICGALTISNDLPSRLQKVNEAVLRYHDT